MAVTHRDSSHVIDQPNCHRCDVIKCLALLILCCSSCFLFFVKLISAERDHIMFCGACIALVDELTWQTDITDEKKKIQIGNFRLNAEGELMANEIKLKTSEIFLTEVFDGVCRYMWNYATTIDPNTGVTNFINKHTRDGLPISMKFANASKELHRELQLACDFILEAHEDWILAMYQGKGFKKGEEEENAEIFCVREAGLCSEQNVTDQMWAYAGAAMGGMNEAEAAHKENWEAQERAEAEAEEKAEREAAEREAAKRESERLKKDGEDGDTTSSDDSANKDGADSKPVSDVQETKTGAKSEL